MGVLRVGAGTGGHRVEGDARLRLMAQGQLRVVNESQGRLIDRAWQATLRTLRSLAGRGGNKESA